MATSLPDGSGSARQASGHVENLTIGGISVT
jgi:hypothetical protein